ncbi:MAG: biopolymer transporter ExbD [Tepidisphaeraceae bacterium]
MRLKKREEEPFEIMLIPMIDVMLVIIIFFLVATTLKAHEKEIPLDLPVAAGALSVEQPADLFIIAVDRRGQPYLNLGAGLEPVNNERLHQRVREVARVNPNQRVRIDGDRATRFEDMIRVVDLCAFEGLHNVGLHTRSINR